MTSTKTTPELLNLNKDLST